MSDLDKINNDLVNSLLISAMCLHKFKTLLKDFNHRDVVLNREQFEFAVKVGADFEVHWFVTVRFWLVEVPNGLERSGRCALAILCWAWWWNVSHWLPFVFVESS